MQKTLKQLETLLSTQLVEVLVMRHNSTDIAATVSRLNDLERDLTEALKLIRG